LRGADFFGGGFLGAGFLAAPFLGGAFLGEAVPLGAAFLAGVLPAPDFEEAGFLAAGRACGRPLAFLVAMKGSLAAGG
jgi:hypothetical protein